MFKDMWLASRTYTLWLWFARAWERSLPGRLILGWFYQLGGRSRYTVSSKSLRTLKEIWLKLLSWSRSSRILGFYFKFLDFVENRPHPFGTFLALASLTFIVLAVNAQLKLVALVSTAGLLALTGVALLVRPKLSLVIIPLFGLVDFMFRSFDPLGLLARSWDDVVLAALLVGIFLHSLRPVQEKVKEENPLRNPLDLPFGVFVFTLILAVIASKVNLGTGLAGVRMLLQTMLFFIPGWYLVKERKDLGQVIQLMLIGAVLVALYGIWQYWLGLQTPEGWIQKTVEKELTTRVFSVLGNPNGLGAFLILFIPVSISLYLNTKRVLPKMYYAVITGILAVTLVYTYSRGAWIGLAAGVFFMALMKDKRLAVPAILGALAVPILKPSIMARFTVLFTPEYLEASERFGRLFVWSKSLEVIGSYPIFGVGPGMFKYHVYNKLGWVAYAAENYFLQIGVEAGILGLAAFVWFLLTFFKYAFALLRGAWGTLPQDPYTRAIIYGVMGGTVAVAVHNLTTNIWGVLIVSVLNWFLLGAVLAVGRFRHGQN